MRTLLSACVAMALALPVLSQPAPMLLPFQGRLTDPNGGGVSDGVRLVQFRIFDAPNGGSPVWAGELHRTTINGGLLNVLLGSKTPFSGVDFDRQLFLEITVDINGDNAITATDPPMLPRQVILPAVFAKESADSRLLGGYPWSALFSEGATNPATARMAGNRIVSQSITAEQIAPQTIRASQLAPNTITGAQLANNSIEASHLTAALIQDAIHPPGTIIAWMGTNNVPPAGWDFCWGQVVGRADPKYARVFSAIGTSNGAGTNEVTFHMPDLRGMFLRGVNGQRTNPFDASQALMDPDSLKRTNSAVGGATGNAVGSVQADDFKSHNHALPLLGDPGTGTQATWGNRTQVPPGVTGSAGGTETRPKNVYVQYLIKL